MDPLPPRLRTDGPEQVVVHTSLRGLITAAAAPVALTLLGGAAVLDGGPRVAPMVVLVAGIVLGIVVLADLPRRVEFDREGLTRVCWLRRQRVPWERVIAIERTRPSTGSVARNLVEKRSSGREATVSGGLVARGRPRGRWLLTDRIESRQEHDRLRALIDGIDRPVVLRATPPHQTAAPTDLYRRRKG